MYLFAIDIVCLLFFLPFFPTVTGNDLRVIDSFQSRTPISNVEFSGDTIYLGAINHIYSLSSSNLSLIQSIATGPVLDSHLCNADLTSCIGPSAQAGIVETNNVNKILHRLPIGLLACGSVRQGTCELRSTDDVEKVIKNYTVPVAANAPNASTVSLVDPVGEKLFVAATFSYDSPYREGFPAVTTRYLYNMLPINAGSLDGEAAVHIRAEYRSRFLVNYVEAFRDEHYIYWATVQNKYIVSNTYAKKVTKLVRVCQDDEKFVSYSEIEIQCRSEYNANFNIMTSMTKVDGQLIGTFVNDESNQESAICVFSMQKIRLTFWYNIDRCRSGTDTIGLAHIGRDSKCINKSQFPLAEDTCLLGVGGTIEVSQLAASQFTGRLLTAIDARLIQHTILLVVGTSQGEVIQMSISGDNKQNLTKYSEFVAGTSAISKLVFNSDEKFYAVIDNQILSYRVSVCRQHKTCGECTASKDPFCGWCMHEGRCSTKSTCRSGVLMLDKCPMMQGPVTPANISIHEGSDATVLVPIANIPPPLDVDKDYECYFGAFKSTGQWTDDGVRCPLPRERPTLKTADHITLPLAIRSSGSRLDIVHQNFTFFDCASYKICSSCSQSSWPCQWCGEKQWQCRSRDDKCSRVVEPQNCPKISKDRQLETLVPDNTNSSISFAVLNMQDLDNSQLQCRFSTDDNKNAAISVNAVVQNDKVHCSSAKFSYSSPSKLKNYTLDLLKSGELIDRTSVAVYKCREMASDCSQCLSLDPKWRCTWCNSGCNLEDSCGTGTRIVKADVLCNEPAITSFSPKGGPLEGGTKIEIYGRDLGSRIQDVQGRVIVAGSKCRVVDYVVSTKMTCIVEKGTGSGPIRITVGIAGKRFVESKEHYTFKESLPLAIRPPFGPIAGGTKIAISGQNLDLGSQIQVHLDNLPCMLVDNQGIKGEILCITSPSPRAYDVSAVRVQIDNAVKVLHARFSYRENPTIDSILPTVSIVSGGRDIVVKGKNLDSVAAPKMYLLSSADSPSEMVSELSNCFVANSTSMTCKSPAVILPTNFRNVDLSTFARWTVGFIMDGVKEVRNLGYRAQITTVPDPQFTPFNGIRVHSGVQPLVIQGKFLTQAAGTDEYVVTVGTERCVVFMLDTNQLFCHVPTKLPAATDENGIEIEGGHPMVVVRVGNVRMELGLIDYDDSLPLLHMNVKRLSFILGSGIAIFAVAIVLIYVLCRRHVNERDRDYKRIQMQMEQMEISVRNECKQAFAELQTDMTDLTMAIDDVGIPYNDRSEFAFRLLFRDSTDLSQMGSWSGSEHTGIYTSQMPIVLGQFDSLLWNRQFLFILIKTVEADEHMTTNERSMVASLLIAVLSRNISYCTDIVLSLMSMHIEQIASGKKAVPTHLLFRQSNSLIEKLFQHWLTLCLYPYLCDPYGPGRNFYLLYKALKCQTEKGPVDAITGNARYSLSEQRLLRESVDSQAVHVLIIPVEGFEQMPVHVRVLRCDTISQVKTKFLDLLYKNQPFSQRISIDNFDLEWSCPRRGAIILTDDECPQGKGIKRLNTVGYYNIQNNALLAMQSRNRQSFTFRSGSSDTTCSAWSSTHLIESAASPTASSDAQYYHLTPPSTSANGSLGNSYYSSTERSKKHSKDQVTARNIPEIYLTRLLTCKGTIHKFVTDFFDSVMFAKPDDPIPVVLKYVLDFLDREAERNGITNPEVIHAWKTNAIVLRLWMQLTQNPDCLFDIQRQPCLDASLVVVGQTMMDAFSQTECPLGKESPSSKLLFAKDIIKYRPVARAMFVRMQNEPAIDDKLFYEHINAISKTYNDGFRGSFAVNELLHWVKANGLRIVEALSHDDTAIHHRLAERLEQIMHRTLSESDHIYATLQ